MITHSYGGKLFTGFDTRKFNGLEGWFVIGKSRGTDGFHVVAKAKNGGGFPTRLQARAALQHIKAARHVNFV